LKGRPGITGLWQVPGARRSRSRIGQTRSILPGQLVTGLVSAFPSEQSWLWCARGSISPSSPITDWPHPGRIRIVVRIESVWRGSRGLRRGEKRMPARRKRQSILGGFSARLLVLFRRDFGARRHWCASTFHRVAGGHVPAAVESVSSSSACSFSTRSSCVPRRPVHRGLPDVVAGDTQSGQEPNLPAWHGRIPLPRHQGLLHRVGWGLRAWWVAGTVATFAVLTLPRGWPCHLQRSLFAKAKTYTTVLVLGAGKASEDLIAFITNRPWLGVHYAGRPRLRLFRRPRAPPPRADAICVTGHHGGPQGPRQGSTDIGSFHHPGWLSTRRSHAVPSSCPPSADPGSRASTRSCPRLFEPSYAASSRLGHADLPTVLHLHVDPLDQAQPHVQARARRLSRHFSAWCSFSAGRCSLCGHQAGLPGPRLL